MNASKVTKENQGKRDNMKLDGVTMKLFINTQ